jgi:hypothetical protein
MLHAQNSTTATILRPYITSISPQSLLTGIDSTLLTINGKRFQRGAAVYFNARKLTNVRIDGDSVIVVVIPGQLTVNADVAVLLVENPDETRIGMRVAIREAPVTNTATALGVQPSYTTATSKAFAVTISGVGFAAGLRVFLGSVSLSITSLSPTRIVVQIPASLNIPSLYTLQVLQNEVSVLAGILVISGNDSFPGPAISRILPPYFLSSGGNLTIIGLNFSPQAIVRLGNTTLAIASISSDRIAVIIPPNLPLNSYLLSVTNPSGGSAVTTIFNPVGC